MAYNPFTWFRRHQKVVFAVMLLVCMFTFVAYFGQGDAVSMALRLVGNPGRGGPVVATLNGQKINETELSRLATLRRMASNFLLQVAWNNHPQALQDLLKKE